MRQSYNSKVNSFLCCSSIFVVAKMLPKVAIQKLIQPYPAGSFPCCSSIFVVTKMFPKVAIQKLIQPYSAGSFPIFVLQTNFPNWKDKTSTVSWLLLFAVSMFVGIFKSKKKIVQSLTVVPLARIEKIKNGVFHISSFWLGM